MMAVFFCTGLGDIETSKERNDSHNLFASAMNNIFIVVIIQMLFVLKFEIQPIEQSMKYLIW